MALTYTLHEAANNYGLNSMPISPSLRSSSEAIIGELLDPIESVNGSTYHVSIPTTNGFTTQVVVIQTSDTTGELVYVDLRKGIDASELMFTAVGNVSFSLDNIGEIFDESFIYSEDDVINGNSFDNALKGFGGNDRIDGGAGIDTAYFTGSKSQYQINQSGIEKTTRGLDGFDTLLNIERLRFDDRSVAYDIDGNAGKAYRIYQAAFDRKPDLEGLGFWINALDTGNSMPSVSSGFIGSTEFQKLYGANSSNFDFLTRLYQNVLHRTPDQDGFNWWLANLNSGAASKVQTLIDFSESSENQLQVIGSIQNGIEYLAYA